MHIGTNSSKAKLTRPVAFWKRAVAFLGGVAGILLALGAFTEGAGWVSLIPLVFGIGGFIVAAEKYETIG